MSCEDREGDGPKWVGDAISAAPALLRVADEGIGEGIEDKHGKMLMCII